MKERRCALLFPGRRKIASEPQQSDTVAVLRVKLHCPACVSEVTRSLQKLPGVMEVSAIDANAEIIQVKGRNLEARKLCEGLWRKTGKRCEVVLLSGIEEQHQNGTTPPAATQQDMNAAAEHEDAGAGGTITVIEAPPADQPAPPQSNGQLQVVHYQDASSTAAADQDLAHHQRPLQEMHEPRIEIKQQTHTIIYGWPSQFQSPPPNIWATSNSVDYYVHDREFRYGEFFSEENPNACNLM